jgi:hypothetical protein
LRVCLRLPAYSASAKVICFIGKLGGWGRGILPNQKVFFRVSLIERHVGQTTAQLASRLVAEPNIPAASTFQNLTTAESVVSRSLASHNQQIHTFLSGSTDKLIIRDRHQKPVGLSLIRGSSQTIPVYKLLLVLKRDRTMPDGYLILTGYPIP